MSGVTPEIIFSLPSPSDNIKVCPSCPTTHIKPPAFEEPPNATFDTLLVWFIGIEMDGVGAVADVAVEVVVHDPSSMVCVIIFSNSTSCQLFYCI